MKLILHFFSLLGVQILQTSYSIFKKSVICIKLLRAVLSYLYMQLSVLNKFCNIVGKILFTV